MEWEKDGFLISDDAHKLDVGEIHSFLSSSYWAQGRSRETVAKSLESSFCLGVYYTGQQVGLARVVTDYATLAYLCDVYIAQEYQRKGLGHFLMKCLFEHPKLDSLKWMLRTRDAQALYKEFGFKDFESTAGWMFKDRN